LANQKSFLASLAILAVFTIDRTYNVGSGRLEGSGPEKIDLMAGGWLRILLF
jgi:hypothetical protein